MRVLSTSSHPDSLIACLLGSKAALVPAWSSAADAASHSLGLGKRVGDSDTLSLNASDGSGVGRCLGLDVGHIGQNDRGRGRLGGRSLLVPA